MATTTDNSTAGYLLNAMTAQRAGDQAAAGTTKAIEAVNNIYGQQGQFTTPYITAGAAINNMLVDKTKPYVDAGAGGIQGMQALQGQALDVNKYLDPSMQFAMQEGQRALQASAAARGGALSGATLKDMASYANNLASQNYQNAFQNAVADRNQQLGISQGLASAGLQGLQPLQQVSQQGIQALDIQGANSRSTGEQLAQLNQNLGVVNANTTTQRNQQVVNALNTLGGGSSATDYVVSDERTKQNVSSAGGGDFFDSLFNDAPAASNNPITSTLNQLQPKQFEYTPQAQQALNVPGGGQVGVMAQNLEQTPMAGMVNTGQDGVKRINVPQATNFALAALSQLNGRINALEGK